ncbi:class I SAM-dependent methyltransferase [Croceicoccus naphthovorans]|uniref:class I SAM-dependent methyltransferase n=1 Tax=Croceicoccus naphthovorans TaxID=1348774 RepID=UPI001C54DCD1|nr:class I SAM-dependent methyltransferase [Croceicoccus naphthovorans]
METRFSGTVPENYDSGLGPFIFERFAEEMARRASDLHPSSVLETAAGTGIVTRRLRDRIPPQCALIATDLNCPMLDFAALKFDEDESVGIEAADACRLPFDDGAFDVVICQFGVMFFPDRGASYAEALRVLKPGGTYLFSVWGSWNDNPFGRIAYSVGAEFCPNDPPAFYKIPFSYHDAGRIRSDLKDAGFDEPTIDTLTHRKALDDPALFARGIVYGNPLGEELVERGIDPDVVCNRMAEALRAQLGESMPVKAMLIAATKP